MDEWRESENKYDWLGRGVYFWEYAPGRAWEWAREQYPDDPAVVFTEVKLGRCLDLADTEFTALLRESYDDIVEMYTATGRALPQNREARRGPGRDEDLKVRLLDRVVIDNLTAMTDAEHGGVRYQTVRAPFEEGVEVYPGAKIYKQSHVQIAVRDKSCISSRIYLHREGTP